MLMDADWRLDAACRGQEDVFWGDGQRMSAPSTGAARAVCARCPVTDACLEDALSRSDPDDWGVWGGTTRHERIVIRRRRRQVAS